MKENIETNYGAARTALGPPVASPAPVLPRSRSQSAFRIVESTETIRGTATGTAVRAGATATDVFALGDPSLFSNPVGRTWGFCLADSSSLLVWVAFGIVDLLKFGFGNGI